MSPTDPNPILDEDKPFDLLERNGVFTLTEAGIEKYRQRFARFGIRVEALRTLEDFQNALVCSTAGFFDELVDMASNGPPSLERKLLIAVAKGDNHEFQRLNALATARNRLGLSLIKGGKA